MTQYRWLGGMIGLVCLLSAGPASADWEARVVARAGTEEAFGVRPVQARVGDVVALTVVLVDPGGDVLADAERVALRRRARRPDGPLPEGAEIRWLRVVPRREHVDLDPPNPGIQTFSNNVLFGPDHGEWLGFDQLEYDTWPLRHRSGLFASGPHLTIDEARPSWGQTRTNGAGSNWFAVEVTLPDGTVVRSADGDDVDRYGLSTETLRVSFREGNDFIDWLGTYFNVPHVFGSSGPSDARHQTDRYIGADCADALVGAWRAAGNDDVAYASVSGIHRSADAVSDVLFIDLEGGLRDEAGNPIELRWGRDVARGDLVAIDFTLAGDWLPRSWDHIGALVGDRGPGGVPNGRLDGNDVLRHMSRGGLVDVPVWTLGPIKIRLWRWE